MFLEEPQTSESLAVKPKSWGEAWSDLAGATDALQNFRDNSNNEESALTEAYERRNRAIHEATGVQLDNPIRKTPQPYRIGPTDLLFGNDDDERRAAAEAEWREKAAGLASQYPDQSPLFGDTVRDEALAITRESQRAFEDAAGAQELGLFGRLTATLAGGFKGALRDPVTWASLVVGGPALGAGRTVAGRIGRAIAIEAAVGAGAEGAVQVMAEGWREEAGVGADTRDILLNVGIAGALGGVLGGGVQGIGEIGRALKLKEPGTAALERVMANRPEPGDVETLAAEIGVDLTAEQKTLLARSFEEDALDGWMAGDGDSPDRTMLMEAARRHFDDPDNNLPPELVERQLADDRAEGLRGSRIMTMEDYERAYGLEPLDVAEQSAGREIAEGVADDLVVDPLEGQRLAPERPAEPLEDPELADAEIRAGEIADPELDARGLVKDPFAVFWQPDTEGRVQYLTPRELIETANETNDYADLLEACGL